MAERARGRTISLDDVNIAYISANRDEREALGRQRRHEFVPDYGGLKYKRGSEVQAIPAYICPAKADKSA